MTCRRLEPVDIFSSEQWRAAVEQWGSRDANVPLRDIVGRVLGVDVRGLDGLLDVVEELPDALAVDGVLADAFGAAAGVPGGSVALALHVYSECLRAWEACADHRIIGNVVGRLPKVVKALALEDGEQQLVDWIATYAGRSLLAAMAVESGLNCSCPYEMEQRAHQVVTAARDALEHAPAIPPAFGPAGTLLRRDAAVSLRYFQLVEQVAQAVFDLRFDKPEAIDAVAAVVRALAEAERSDEMVGDVYATELRSHRRALEGLLAGVGQPVLHVTSATVVYCYPFALELDPVHVVEVAAQRFGTDRVHKTALTDVWRGDDPQGRHYAGVTLVLPDLHVTPTYQEAHFTATAEVRFSRLGNHYVRVEATLEDADLHTTNQALRRVSRSMGDEAIESGPQRWPRLTEFAVDTVAAVSAGLGTTAVESAERSFHVVVDLRSLSVVEPDGTRRDARLDDLPETFGASLLLNPVFRAATSLEEWVRAPVGRVDNLLATDGLAGELCVRSAHSTLLWLPDAPDFLRQEYEQLAEFAASLPGLLHRWQHKLGEEAAQLAREMEGLRPDAAAEAATSLAVLQDRELRLRRLESEVRQLVAFLHSPNLVRSEEYRRFLDGLYAASHLEGQEQDLTSQLAVLAGQYDRVSAITAIILNRQAQEAAQAERRREVEAAAERQRAEDKLRVALAVLGASSLGGVLNFFRAPWWVAVPALVVALGVIGFVSLPLLRGRPRDPDPGA